MKKIVILFLLSFLFFAPINVRAIIHSNIFMQSGQKQHKTKLTYKNTNIVKSAVKEAKKCVLSKKNNSSESYKTFGIISFIFGCLSLILSPISILGLIFGIISLIIGKKRKNWFAYIGLGLSLITFLLLLIIIL